MLLKPHPANRCYSCVLAAISAVGLTLVMAFSPAESAAQIPVAVDAARRVELVKLVRQDCGSCHGLTLNGGLGPALVPDALKGKPADYLKAIILHGRAGTAMPPWMRFLSDADAEWIVINLQKGFPDGH